MAARTSPAASMRRSCSAVRTVEGQGTDVTSACSGLVSPGSGATGQSTGCPSSSSTRRTVSWYGEGSSGFWRVGLHWYDETQSSCLARVNAT